MTNHNSSSSDQDGHKDDYKDDYKDDHKDSNSINPKLQQCLQQLLADLQLDDAPAGGSLVVYQAGKCIARASIGMAQAELPWQPDTLSLNFSTGKGVLATLVHVLVTQQLLDYDLPIASYWPAFAANGKADITLRGVMSHQAGLFAITTIDADNETLVYWDKMVAKVAAMPTAQAHNSGSYVSAYSALVYGWVLGGLIEQVTDMSLASALRHYLTEPLGIADSCYFGVPINKVQQLAKPVKNFSVKKIETSEQDRPQLHGKRHKPVLKADSAQTLDTYAKLPSYHCWQQLATDQKLTPENTRLSATQINRLYFDHSKLNLNNYKAALIPTSKQPIDYYSAEALQAVIPAVNGVASAQALATIYAMLANGGEWQGQTLIDTATFAQLSTVQGSGMDAVMPTNMEWRLGYHRLLQLCAERTQDEATKVSDRGFGHMGYNGSVAWCDPAQQLSFAFVHNFDVTMLNDIRQFALTEALLALIDV
ncbi:CubicO group peptidase (beta-lactamase class C family) [Psychrobacter sp. PL15]|uniref:serine hydrolase domain-containing protein n=1 Tax=Psychrobacter sp. PL15 TaxID=3071719 RepID=UPI002DF9FD79|nr:CubicO group peptidase (beta-lactamase class C family) [Psychrobacter sp. PL15]